MLKITRTEIYGYLFILVAFGISLYFGFTDEDFFNERIANEDGIIENIGAFMLLLISILCLSRLVKQWKGRAILWKLGTAAFVLAFFFGAGEEISWGQRIFEVESGAFFQEHNIQGETNLHNLVVGETKINKLVFSQLLLLTMFLYLIIIPIFYPKKRWLQRLMDRFAVPVVHWHNTAMFLAGSVLVAINPANRIFEVYEMAFAVIFFLIFLNPVNGKAFAREPGAVR